MATAPLLKASNPPLPPLDNGQSQHVGHWLAGYATAHPLNLLWDIGLPLVVAIALPLILKRALESRKVAEMFRFSPSKQRPADAPDAPDIDFDSD